MKKHLPVTDKLASLHQQPSQYMDVQPKLKKSLFFL